MCCHVQSETHPQEEDRESARDVEVEKDEIESQPKSQPKEVASQSGVPLGSVGSSGDQDDSYERKVDEIIEVEIEESVAVGAVIYAVEHVGVVRDCGVADDRHYQAQGKEHNSPEWYPYLAPKKRISKKGIRPASGFHGGIREIED